MIPLFETLVALVEGLEVPAGSGVVVDSAAIEVPLEGRVVPSHGPPVFLATVPHTRWRSGFLPPVHVARLRIEEATAEERG